MKALDLTRALILGAICVPFSNRVEAGTIQTLGPGSAVTSIDRAATFDSLTSSNVVHLDAYSENALSITTSGDSWAADWESPGWADRLDPFHIPGSTDRAFYAIAWGNTDWVTIQTTDSRRIFGLEFMYGNCWTTGDIYGQYPWGNHDATVDWQTWIGDTLVSSGTIGVTSLLELATILGFYDPAGFDRLLVMSKHPLSVDPNLQAIALDTLHVQLSDCSGVNNCSGHGACVATNTCACDAGWTGVDCATPACPGVSNCSGHGVCIAPDTCQCDAQWTGADCATSTIPATSQWGLLALCVAIAAAGTIITRRRSSQAAWTS